MDEHSELAVDWFNGRRTPDTNQLLTASITGLDLGSDAVRMFRAVVESTCFGAKAIVERFIEQGILVKGLIGLGGVAKKSPFIMQMMADVMNMPIKIHKSEQTCALGAAMFAATVAGVYEKVEEIIDTKYNIKPAHKDKILGDSLLIDKFISLHIEFENGLHTNVKNQTAYILTCLDLVKKKTTIKSIIVVSPNVNAKPRTPPTAKK